MVLHSSAAYANCVPYMSRRTRKEADPQAPRDQIGRRPGFVQYSRRLADLGQVLCRFFRTIIIYIYIKLYIINYVVSGFLEARMISVLCTSSVVQA